MSYSWKMGYISNRLKWWKGPIWRIRGNKRIIDQWLAIKIIKLFPGVTVVYPSIFYHSVSRCQGHGVRSLSHRSFFIQSCIHFLSPLIVHLGWRVTARTGRRSVIPNVSLQKYFQWAMYKISPLDVVVVHSKCPQFGLRRVMSLSFLGIITTLVLYMAQYVIPEL